MPLIVKGEVSNDGTPHVKKWWAYGKIDKNDCLCLSVKGLIFNKIYNINNITYNIIFNNIIFNI